MPSFAGTSDLTRLQPSRRTKHVPLFPDLKDRANKAKTTGLTKFNDTRDKYSSRSSKDFDRDTIEARRAQYSSPTTQAAPSPPRPPPPPSHARSASVARPSTLNAPPVNARPPVVRRESRPDSNVDVRTHAPLAHPPPPMRSAATANAQANEIDWAHLSVQDKEVFFSWLDEFFSRHLHIAIPPRETAPTVQVVSRPLMPLKPVSSFHLFPMLLKNSYNAL